MPQRDGYLPGVPCWVDTSQPDPEAAAAFYSGLFGWECENAMPPDSPGKYYVARLGGGTVGGIGSLSAGEPAVWRTYIAVESADETAEKVRQAGGQVVTEPFDVMSEGRMAVFTDTEGAAFCVWEARDNKGAQVVNEAGSLNFNTLNTRDAEPAKSFYGSVFGWETLDMGMWTLPGYGDYLEQLNPGTREQMAALGAPEGFEDVVAALTPVEDGDPYWSVTFAVDDADATAARAEELGGKVVVAPFDAPWVRTTVISDPPGATFVASRFVPENKALAAEAVSA